MNMFCKGVLVGTITGMAVATVAISKNKNLYNFMKEKVECASNKISKLSQKLKKNMEEKMASKSSNSQEIDQNQNCNPTCESSNCTCS